MDRSHAARLLPCRPKGPNLPRLRTRRATKGHKGRQRPARGPVRAWRASHATLWFFGGVLRRSRRPIGPPPAKPPSYRSYTSYMSYRGVYQSANQLISQSAGRSSALWHVADVPGVQGKVEVWKLGCLEVWLSRCTTISPVARLSGVLFSVSVLRGRGRFGPLGLHALFSVLQGAKAPFPCRGVGQRPTSLPINFPIRQDTFLGNHRDARDGHGREAQRAER